MLALQFIFFYKVTKWPTLVFRFLWCSYTYKYIGNMFSGPFATLQPPFPSPHLFPSSSLLKRQDLAVCPCSPGWPSAPAPTSSAGIAVRATTPCSDSKQKPAHPVTTVLCLGKAPQAPLSCCRSHSTAVLGHLWLWLSFGPSSLSHYAIPLPCRGCPCSGPLHSQGNMMANALCHGGSHLAMSPKLQAGEFPEKKGSLGSIDQLPKPRFVSWR